MADAGESWSPYGKVEASADAGKQLHLKRGMHMDEEQRIESASFTTDSDLLVKLAHDESSLVRAAVAWNHRTDAVTLGLLAQDESPEVRRRVARHRNTLTQTLVALSADTDDEVRSSVSSNAACPEELLECFA
ncbi:MAG: hypothetical protein ACKN9D_00270, partial [Actinomycetales bacterium]